VIQKVLIAPNFNGISWFPNWQYISGICGNIDVVYKWYILSIGGLYGTYPLLREPETTVDNGSFFETWILMTSRPPQAPRSSEKLRNGIFRTTSAQGQRIKPTKQPRVHFSSL